MNCLDTNMLSERRHGVKLLYRFQLWGNFPQTLIKDVGSSGSGSYPVISHSCEIFILTGEMFENLCLRIFHPSIKNLDFFLSSLFIMEILITYFFSFPKGSRCWMKDILLRLILIFRL